MPATARRGGFAFAREYKATHSRVTVYDYFVLRLPVQTRPYF